MLSNLLLWKIDPEKGSQLEISALTKINYLVGENGSGKTQLIQKILAKHPKNSIHISQDLFLEMVENQNLENLQIPKGVKLICITEPEYKLYPKLQKLIPSYLNQISLKFKVQIIVSTNSPFVIAAAGYFEEEELKTAKKSLAQQKVYVLHKGEIASKHGELQLDFDNKPKGRFGYWGRKANFIASQMFSAGFSAYSPKSSEQEIINETSQPILVLCEGSHSQADAIIYNRIFEKHKERPVLFISSSGTHELSTSFDLFRQIKNSLSANFQLLMLRDRDHEFSSLDQIDLFIKNNPGRRVLHRRAIECYLYNSETASLLLESQGLKLNTHDKLQMDNLQKDIQTESENGIPGPDYKDRLKGMYKHMIRALDPYITKKIEENPAFKLSTDVISRLITPETQTFKELDSAIFL